MKLRQARKIICKGRRMDYSVPTYTRAVRRYSKWLMNRRLMRAMFPGGYWGSATCKIEPVMIENGFRGVVEANSWGWEKDVH